MTFVSYAQNYEDVMLWRVLKHIEKGFYIDVGANDPNIESVTKALYMRGWRGINVEPLPSHYEDLVVARPRDINIWAAAGASEGVIDLWECQVRGWATASQDVAKRHEAAGHPGTLHKVPLTTLRAICEKFSVNEIHFLKIDVEGFEEVVIKGMDFRRFRPWLMVVEATVPNSQNENYHSWEFNILENGYKFAYCDGLNRFYVADEHADELLSGLKYPPNVFVDFKLANQLEAEARAQQAEAKVQQAEAKVQQAEAKAQQAEAKAQQAESIGQHYVATLNAVYASKSWRWTAPLRWVFGQARRLKHEGLKSRIKAFAKKALRKINHELLLRPSLRQKLVGVSRRLGIHASLKTLLRKAQGHSASSTYSLLVNDAGLSQTNLENLSSRARQIYGDLKKTVEQKNKKGNH